MTRVSEAVRSRNAAGDKRTIILDAARSKFRQNGYKRTSMDDIAREAGVAKGTLYIYFASKEELFIAMSQQFQQAMSARLLQASMLDLPLADKMIALMDARIGAILRWKAETPHAQDLIATHERLLQDSTTNAHGEFRNLVSKALKEGIKRGEADPKLAGLSFEGAIETLIAGAAGAAWRAQPKIFAEQLPRIIRLCLRGMQA